MGTRSLTLYVPAANLVALESNIRTGKVYRSSEAAWTEADRQREQHGYPWVVWRLVAEEMNPEDEK